MLVVAVLLLHFLDFLTTYVVLVTGAGREANVFMQHFNVDYNSVYYTFVATTFALVALYAAASRGAKSCNMLVRAASDAFLKSLYVLLVAKTLAVANNVHVLLFYKELMTYESIVAVGALTAAAISAVQIRQFYASQKR